MADLCARDCPRLRRAVVACLVFAALVAGGTSACRRDAAPEPVRPPSDLLVLPRKPGSVRFAAIGDAGRGHAPQYEVSSQMQAYRKVFDYGFVIMLGDNVYDGGTPEDYRLKFELPYKPLLDDKVPFYATIGNHDAVNQPFYEPFHMGGKRYYTFEADQSLLARLTDTEIEFFMVDTETLDRTQLAWLARELDRSDAEWKIPIFHRPIYTSGRYATPARIFRNALEPLFVRYGVKVALSGHEHFHLPQRTRAAVRALRREGGAVRT